MDWIKILTLIGVNTALIGGMATLILWAINKLDADIKNIATQVESSNKRLDGHAMRIDQLYSIIVNLLKEGKK